MKTKTKSRTKTTTTKRVGKKRVVQKRKPQWSRGLNLKKGTLRKHGYSTTKGATMRRIALRRAANEYGRTVVIRKLVVVANLQGRRNPKVAAIFRSDANWVRANL
jgi:hypothetical protein